MRLPKYLNNWIHKLCSSFARMNRGIRKASSVALVGAVVGILVYGCRKQETETQDTSPPTSVLLEDRLYKQTKIAFSSFRDGDYEIYVMNAGGGEQKRLTYNSAYDWCPYWSPFLKTMK